MTDGNMDSQGGGKAAKSAVSRGGLALLAGGVLLAGGIIGYRTLSDGEAEQPAAVDEQAIPTIEELQARAEADPLNSEAWTELGFALSETGEFDAAARAYRQAMVSGIDGDGDGKISAAELEAHMSVRMAERIREMAEARIAAQDLDGDGALSIEEMIAPPMPPRLFDRADADGDGAVSQEEFEAAKARMQDMREGRGRGKGGKEGRGHGDRQRHMHEGHGMRGGGMGGGMGDGWGNDGWGWFGWGMPGMDDR